MKDQIEGHILLLSFFCPETNKHTMKIIENNMVISETEECHICGSHVKIYLDIQCNECGKWHEIILRDQ